MKQKPELLSWSDPREGITDLYCITMLFLFLLFPGFSGYGDITYAKFIFLLFATALWIVLCIAVSLCGKRALPRPGAAQWACLVFFALAAVSAFCSPWFPDSIPGAGRYDGLITLSLYCLIFLGVSSFTRLKPLHLYAFGAAVTLCCALAILQLFGLNPLRLYPNDLRWQDAGIRYSGTYLGTIGNTNLLDAVLSLAIPMFAVELLRERRRVFAVPLVLSLIVVVIAGGSGIHFALCAFFAAALLLLPRSRRVRRICAVIAAALVLGAFALLWFWPGSSGTLYEASQMLRGHFEYSYGSSRIMIWHKSLLLVPEHPLLGGGPGTAALRLDIHFSRYVPEIGTYLHSYVDNTHNVYLGYLVNNGVLGLLAYLTLLILCAVRALRLSRQSDSILACALAVFCGAVHAFFGLGLCLTEPFFFLLLGLCCPPDRATAHREVTTCK